MPIKPLVSIIDLIGRRFDEGGLQFDHIIGRKFYNQNDLEWLRSPINANECANFIVFPESR